MTDFLITLGTIYAFSTAFLWLRAVFSVGVPDFSWGTFLYENRNRMILQGAGSIIGAVLWTIDPTGATKFIESQGAPAFIASAAGIGLGVGWLSLFSKVRI